MDLVIIHSIKQIAESLGVCERTINRRVKAGDLPPLEEIAGVKGYTPATIEAIQVRARDRARLRIVNGGLDRFR